MGHSNIRNFTLNTDTRLHPAPEGPRARTSSHAEVAKLKDLITDTLEDAKAEDIIDIDLRGKSSIADQMIVASGNSRIHVGAIADQLRKGVRKGGYGRPRIEGLPHCDWVLVDCGDVIIHIFRPEVRSFYNLEKLWSMDRPQEQRAI